jgi:putative ABC transport system permease protein
MNGRRAFGERLLRLAILAHPPAFRARYRDEMLTYYRQACHAGEGWPWRARFLAASVLAAIGEGWQQRRSLRERRPAAPSARSFESTGSTGARGVAMHAILGLPRELRLAFRSLTAQPGLTTAVVFTIGLAVAANTALFSVFDGLLFRPLPYRDAERLVHLEIDQSLRIATASREARGEALTRVSTTSSLVERADIRGRSLFDQSGPATTEWRLRPYAFSMSAFELLGVRPFLGRAFVEADATAEAMPVLLGYDVWLTRFGGNPETVGATVRIPGTASGERYRVIGVMPRGFAFPEGANFWTPIRPSYGSPDIPSYARVAPDVTIDALRAELSGIAVTPLREHVRPDGAFALGVLLAASGLLLLLAWVHVAGLLFARASGRTAEIGVRLAMGASRLRLIRQFVLEAGTLITIAMVLAVALTPVLTTLIVSMLPPEITVGQHVSPDARAFGFAAALSAVGLLIVALAPVGLVRLASPIHLLRGDTRTGSPVGRTRMRTALFVGQLALAAALVYVTGLTLRSYIQISEARLGFDPRGLYAIQMPRGDAVIDATGRERLDRQRMMVAETIARIAQLAGVRVVSGSNDWPMEPGALSEAVLVAESDPGRDPLPGRSPVIARGYPEALGIPLVAGREPTAGELDNVGFPPRLQLALANENLARRLERFGSSLGQVVALTSALRFQIVGVVPDIVLDRADHPVEPTLFRYLPPPAAVGVVLARLEPGRTPEDVGLPVVLERIWGSPAPTAFPITDAARRANVDYRARTFILSLICALSVPLTLVGVAGALSHATRRRTREIAIALALGAEPRAVRQRVIGHAVLAAAIAIGMGVAAGIGIGRLMAATLYGVVAADPTSIAGTATLMLVVAWMAAFVPARRASAISPVEALRE